MFNILSPRIDEDTVFLDLCAGSGAVGIEAISRGAKHATFVDISRKACALIEENLDLLGVPEQQSTVVMSDAEKFLAKTETSFDIIYFDPPYADDYVDVLVKLGMRDSRTLSEFGILIAEHFTKHDLPDEIGELRRWRLLKQGDSSLSFYTRE